MSIKSFKCCREIFHGWGSIKYAVKLCVTSQNSHAVVEAGSAAAGASLGQVLEQGSLQVPLQGVSLGEVPGGHQFIQGACLSGNKGLIFL